jgi:hypothetical protein
MDSIIYLLYVMGGFIYNLSLLFVNPLFLPYLRVYNPHFFDKNLPSKIGCGLYTEFKELDPPRKIRYHTGD